MTVTTSAVLVFALIQAPVPPSTPGQAPHAMILREAVSRQHVQPDVDSSPALESSSGHAHRSTARKVAFAVGGGAAGLVVGALVGAKISDGIGCDCLLPGLRGAVIGGIGGAVGGVFLGSWLGSR